MTIVASDAWGTLPDDVDSGVVRVGDLRGARSLRRLLGRGELPREGDQGIETPPPPALLTKVFVPEMYVVTWLPALAVAVRRLLRSSTFDCLVTSSPPESAHLVGLLLGRRRPAWIADFRDGWLYEPWRDSLPTRLQRALDARLERLVVSSAEVAVAATEPIARDLTDRLGAQATWVPNGWDPDSVVGDGAELVRRGDAHVVLVYTGGLAGPRGRDPNPLFLALQQSRADGLRLRLVHAGHVTVEERALIARAGATDLVQHTGMLDRQQALALQRSADALVLLTSRSASEATGKLFEYLAAGRPIIALAEANEAARIVRETRTGIAVPPDNVDAIVAAIRQAASGELARAYAPRGLEQFTYPGPAKKMAELVEEAIALRGSRKSRVSR